MKQVIGDELFPFIFVFILGLTVLFASYGLEEYGTREKAWQDGLLVCQNGGERVAYEFDEPPIAFTPQPRPLSEGSVADYGVVVEDSEREPTCSWVARCPDWSFHLCYAENFTLSNASGVASNCSFGAYSSYTPFLAAPAYYLNTWFGLPITWFYIGILVLANALLAYTLHRYGGNNAVIFYFLFLFIALYLLGSPRQFWVGRAVCGVIPWALTSALFFFLMLQWDEGNHLRALIPALGVALFHNYGVGLVALFVIAVFLHKFLLEKRFNCALWEALFFLLTVTFAVSYLLFGVFGEMAAMRILGILYFFVAVALANMERFW